MTMTLAVIAAAAVIAEAAHSVREFSIEIGTVICGILVALHWAWLFQPSGGAMGSKRLTRTEVG